MFWKLTFLIFMLVVLFGHDLDNGNERELIYKLFMACLIFVICMGVSNLLIDVLAIYGVKPV